MNHEITRTEDIGYIAAHCSCGWSGSVDKIRKGDYVSTEQRLSWKIGGHLGGSRMKEKQRIDAAGHRTPEEK